MSKTFTTPKGTKLPILNLKGKDYMQVAQRLVWFVEENPNYTINTDLISVNETETVAKVTVNILDNTGKVIKSAMATKRENLKGFADHTEKAETGALGRALSMLGFGTQFSEPDLDEGERLADSPVARTSETVDNSSSATSSNGGGFKRPSGFSKPTKKAASSGAWS